MSAGQRSKFPSTWIPPTSSWTVWIKLHRPGLSFGPENLRYPVGKGHGGRRGHRFCLFRGHPFVKKSSLKLSELLSEPFLLTEKNASYRFVLDRYLAALGCSIEPFLEIGNTEFIIRLLKENHGLSFLPRFAVENELTAGTLSILPVEDFHMKIFRQLFYHRDKWVTREMEAFISLAKETGAPAGLPRRP